jgi:hypothetical protein
MDPNELEIKQRSEVAWIDVSFLRSLAVESAAALVSLWDPFRGSFWRSSEHRTAEQNKPPVGIFPTVTFRSLEALLRVIEDMPAWAEPSTIQLATDIVVPALLSRKEEDLHSSLGLTSEGGVLNPFTLSLYIDCLARICCCDRLKNELQKNAIQKLEAAVQHLLGYAKLATPSQMGSEVHPFVLFHIARAIATSTPHLPNQAITAQLKDFQTSLGGTAKQHVRVLLAQDSLGVINPGEGVALAFCAAILAANQQPEDLPFVNAALRVAFKFQDSAGCWPLGRIVPENKDIEVKRDLQIPTYEIAWGLTEAVLSIVEFRRDPLADGITDSAFACLMKATKYISVSAVQLDSGEKSVRGWCSEHAFGKPIIESWTSATVLQAILSFHQLAQAIFRQRTLTKFASADPKDADWPKWQRWSTYKAESEPEEDIHILEYLDRVIIRSILSSPGQLPRATAKNVSILFFGPPGTAKTTLVKALADGLKWPVVFLSPGNFIERGLEYIEAQARSVFEVLQQLSQAVVLFDECDELFRDRKPLPGTDQVRNITAFVTASMLPKLQDLHDRGRVVFAICTNHLESMDPAIKRGGRIDHLIGIGPPDKSARRRIIEQVLLADLEYPHMSDAIDELASETERFTRAEIERAAKIIRKEFKSGTEARAQARQIANGMKASLTISVQEFEEFNRIKREVSHPHQERGLK